MNLFLDLFFPTTCAVCNHANHLICNDCFNKLRPTEQKCPMCCQRSYGGITHPRCKKFFGLDGLNSLWSYRQPEVRKIIKAVKYKFNQRLVSNIFERVTIINLEADFITPLPLHFKRLNWRGFNQAELLSNNLSAKLHIPIDLSLMRHKNTKPLSNMKHGSDRKQEIKNAFTTTHPVKEKIIILVDDVFTSGATMREACTTLKRSGAKQVFGWTLAN